MSAERVIRLAVASDEPAIRDCARQAFSRYVPRIGRKPAPMLADYAAHIARSEVHVATDERNVIEGFIVFFAVDGHILLDCVAVHPAAVGPGRGKARIRFCEAAARAQGMSAVQLCTNEKMSENLAMYPRLGYVELGLRVEDGYNRVYFEKTLV